MSPDQGRRGTTGRDGVGSGRGPAAVRRLGLLVFGAAFIVLFVVIAIAEGLGDPSVPSGNVALVEDVPGDIGEVSEARFVHALELTAKQAGEKEAPKPGDPKYEELKKQTLDTMFETIWLQGLAAEWGIEATDREIAEKLQEIKKESFKSEAEFKKFLKESGYTSADIDERVKLQILSEGLQKEIKEKAPKPTESEIEAYYEAAKATQFTQKPSWDVRLIVNKDRAKAEEAKAAVTKDNSEDSWKKAAKEFSEDPTTKENGGLQQGVQEGVLEEPLNKTVINAPEGRIEGPIKAQRGYTVLEVAGSSPESVQELEAVESQIDSVLTQRLEQEYFARFATIFNNEWIQRTFCASGFVVERCSNYQYSGHPASAPEGCYEENPKGGRPEACPAPVLQAAPAMPGTVTPLEPKGDVRPQRPRPLEEPGAAGTEETPGLPEGAVPPPTGAPPAE